MKNILNNETAARRRVKNRSSSKTAGKLIALAIVLLIAMSAATQYFAYALDYQAALGSNFNHVYLPWKILVWYFSWPNDFADVYKTSLAFFAITLALGFIFVLLWHNFQSNSEKVDPFLHGSAEFARDEDVKRTGLIATENKFLGIFPTGKLKNKEGVYVGSYIDSHGNQHYLRHNGPEHVLCYAPTRSGKGVGLVIPTLLSWQHSAVITDLKGELWALTAGWRKKYGKNKVLRFEPAKTGSIKWNPLDEVRIETDYEVGDVQNIATLIVDPDGRGLNDHWQKVSMSLLTGVIIHVLYMAKYHPESGYIASLPGVDAALSNPNRPIEDLWQEMCTSGHINGQTPHPVAAAAGKDMIDRAAEEAGSVLSSAKSYLALYRDPVVAANVNKSEFRIDDLMNHTTPVSLYIVTQPNDKDRLRPLIRLLVNMIVRMLTKEMKFSKGRAVKAYKHRLLCMFDEFASMRKLEIIQESLAFAAGYGIKFYIIMQDITQMRDEKNGYGAQEQITSNCHVQVAYPPNRVETAEYLSKQTGVTTITKEQITTSGKRAATMHGQVTRSMQSIQRPLMTADELMRMPAPKKDKNDELIVDAGDMVIFVAGHKTIYGKQSLYFQDPIFVKRSEVDAPGKTDKIRSVEQKVGEKIEITSKAA